MSEVRNVFINTRLMERRITIDGLNLCFLFDDCVFRHNYVIATYYLKQGGGEGDIKSLMNIIKEGRFVKPLYVYLDSGGFQLFTGSGTSIPEGVVNAAVQLSRLLGNDGIIYMTLLDYPSSLISLSNDEFEKRLAKTVEYYTRQLDYYYHGGMEQKNIRVIMPIQGGIRERVERFMRQMSPLIRDYGITGYALTGITGREFHDSEWIESNLERLSALSRGVLDSGSRVIDIHFLAYFEKRLWYVGAVAEASGFRTVTADSMAVIDYIERYQYLVPSIPTPIHLHLKYLSRLVCNCPICTIIERNNGVEKAVQGVKPYNVFISLHNLYAYLNFSKIALNYPRIGIEAMGINYDSLISKIKTAVKGEYQRGLLGFLRK